MKHIAIQCAQVCASPVRLFGRARRALEAAAIRNALARAVTKIDGGPDGLAQSLNAELETLRTLAGAALLLGDHAFAPFGGQSLGKLGRTLILASGDLEALGRRMIFVLDERSARAARLAWESERAS